jgi:hypothetical protein
MGRGSRRLAHHADAWPVGISHSSAVGDQPGALDGPDEGRGFGLGYTAVLRAYESSCELRVAAREVDERWTELHWIHGDLTATNVMVEHQPALRVSFIDPSCVGLGGPVWDLGRSGRHDRLVVATLAGSATATGGLSALGVPAGRRTWPALSGHPGRTRHGYRHLGRRFPSESSSQDQAEANLEFWLDRARGYAARVGCLMAVARRSAP